MGWKFITLSGVGVRALKGGNILCLPQLCPCVRAVDTTGGRACRCKGAGAMLRPELTGLETMIEGADTRRLEGCGIASPKPKPGDQ